MDVTRHNFKDTYSHVEKCVSEANFIAIDGEFTGVSNSTFNLTNYDTPEERYHKLRHNLTDFLLMQYGLVTFKWCTEEERYIAEAFNFYVFPFRSQISGVPDRIFSCQSSSIDFLASQGFDFNKVFYHGIPYLRQNEEVSMRTALNEKHICRMQNFKSPRKSMDSNGAGTDNPSPAGSPTKITDPKTQFFLDGIRFQVEEYLKTSKQGESLELEPCNSYLRKILYEKLPTMFPVQLIVESKFNEKTRQRYLVVSRAGSEEDMQRRNEEAKAKDESYLQDAIGFSRVIQLLARHQKLVIGHNVLLDLIYTVQQFVHQLPPTLEDFKAVLSSIFPRIIDTKLMGSMPPFRETIMSTTLQDLHSRLTEKPFFAPDVKPPDKYDPSKSDVDMDANLHEAAYDAYITGVSFLSMVNFLKSFRKDGNPVSNISAEIISPYINKVFLFRISDIPYLNLGGNDLAPSRAHVFHLQFPMAWKAADIRTLFSPIGTAINISWINDTQCFVGLFDKNMAHKVRKVLMKPGGMESNPYTLRSYEEYQREIAGQIYSSPVVKANYNITPSSRNRVWRPPPNRNTNNSGGPSTSAVSYAQAVASDNNNHAGQTDTPKSAFTNRKRSGEDAALGKPSSVRRISSTSNRINCLDLDEPDVKRQRSVQEMVVSAAESTAQTDIPALLVSSTTDDPPRDEEMEKVVAANPKQGVAFEVPTNWG